MPMTTLSVASAIVPATLSTYFSHYLFRENLREKPTAHISYHEGLNLIRQFLDYASKHTVEDLQQFTAQWVPCPHWVRLNDAEVVPKFLERAAALVISQLGRRGVEKVGGRTWWQWRRPETPLRAEWIEMRKEYQERKHTGAKCERVILYVHGGAYYFGSVDEHRYQLQRHARKLKAQVLAPRYRLAPQFPFPCGLYDCLATYFYLLEHFHPSQILFAGDSAGGGMVLSLLVTLRDQGQPLPAGTILLSPWVDLTHSFPSVAGDGQGDYIPPHGFLHKPSMAWPPPPVDEVKKASGSYGAPSDAIELPAMEPEPQTPVEGGEPKERPNTARPAAQQRPTFGPNQGIYLDGKVLEIKEQIQLYTTNELLAHPLVSPVMQPTLGGLPPMLIQVGGAELLRDEQIYIAHKAANPKAYLPTEEILDKLDPRREAVNRYPPTSVQLQVWDDLCHVPHTLSFTRPAKYMYRSVAQFGAWALAHAQHKGIEMDDGDAASFISSNNGDEENLMGKKEAAGSMLDFQAKAKEFSKGAVGKAGDPLPPFQEHMIRQRVTRHGVIYPLPPANEMPCLAIDPKTIGEIKAGPVRKWLAAKAGAQHRYAAEQKKVDKKRARDMKAGYDEIPGEFPPPTALVGRRLKGVAPEEKKKGKSWGLAMWSGWGSSHDENTLHREEKAHRFDVEGASLRAASSVNVNADEKGWVDGGKLNRTQTNLTVPNRGKIMASGRKARRTSNTSMLSNQPPWVRNADGRPGSRDTRVTDTGQADDQVSVMSGSPAPVNRSLLSRRTSATESTLTTRPVSAGGNSPIPMASESRARNRASQAPIPVPTTSEVLPESEKIAGSENTFLSPSSSRPHNGQVAYPFRLRKPTSNPSLATLDSERGTPVSTTPGSGFHSELAGDSPAPATPAEPAEMGDGKPEERNEDVSPTSTDGGFVASTLAAVSTAAAAATSMVADTVVPRKSSETEVASPVVASPVSDQERLLPLAADVQRMPTPPTPEVSEPAVSPVHSPMQELDRRDLVSPIETPKSESPIPPPEQQTKEKASDLEVKSRSNIFDHRTSTLGSIGADGMPIAHHDFPIRASSSKSVPRSPPAEPVPALPTALDDKSKPTTTTHSPGSSDEAKAAPFKLRNAVPTAGRSATPEAGGGSPVSGSATPEEVPATSQPKPAPFKLRHTVLDLSSKRTNSSEDSRGTAAGMMPAPLNPSRTKTPSPGVEYGQWKDRNAAAEDQDKPASSSSPPPSYDTTVTIPRPHTNIVMPETVTQAGRPVFRSTASDNNTVDVKSSGGGGKETEEVPPPPPPKDEKPKVLYSSKSSRSKSGSGSMNGKGSAPAAPAIGELGFEKKKAPAAAAGGGVAREKEKGKEKKERTGLETFVTADEMRGGAVKGK